ncbi:E3 ubiquitin-protein ligase UPL5-like [Papaver somniferum]|uniref:E3 ubiquitin-protein ligase UPL5-like n=1 Tax=Papaver somniferum TaxID=3469 RepID=UPI000E6F7336|nr:E3 ubiquitin-protein ligase UPL5-like [Papaver somniferum]
MEQLLILDEDCLPLLLAELLKSSIKEDKEIAKECVRLFLIDPKTNSGFFFPRSIQNQCAPIALTFCGLFRKATDEDGQQLYYSCRETLVFIPKSIAFSNRTRYFGVAKKGLSLPVNRDDLEGGGNPCYLVEIFQFHCEFSRLVINLKQGLRCLEAAIRDAGSKLKFNTGWWSLFLSVLKDLHSISKIYSNGEERLSAAFREYPLAINYLIRHLKRGDDHLWLLKYDSAIDFESRRHLVLMMFPEVQDDNEKLHKLLIDRSHLFKESFELIAHVKPKSLHSGIFVEFKDEVATGRGVLREWFLLVCQALFSPENSLFVACPEDRHRFFPNPAQLKPEQLNLFGFCGRVIALALMHQVQVGSALDRVFFLQLVEEELSLEDIRCADPIMYRSCKQILEMDADFVDSDAMGLTFVREIEDSGSRKTVELCPGGNNIVVNSKNREQYVHLLIQHLFVKSISAKVAYFARGFADILCKRRLAKSFFQAIDLKGLDFALLGDDTPILLKDWKAHTMYDGYRETDEQICWFWKVVEGLSMEQQRELLFFWTSVKYLPVNGFSGLPYPLTIYKTSGSDERLPSAHTCFFRLSLPHYLSLAITQQHLSFICQRHVGCSFGFV